MKNPSIKTLKKKADKVFSEYVRKRDKGKCFTSKVRKRWDEQQAGHFLSRVHLGTRFDERNCHCQTVRDNIFLRGNLIVYYEQMLKAYGQEVIDELKAQSNLTLIEGLQHMFPLQFKGTEIKEAYQFVIDYYTYKLKEL